MLKAYPSPQETTERHVSCEGRYESQNVGAQMNFPGSPVESTTIPDFTEKCRFTLHRGREYVFSRRNLETTVAPPSPSQPLFPYDLTVASR